MQALRLLLSIFFILFIFWLCFGTQLLDRMWARMFRRRPAAEIQAAAKAAQEEARAEKDRLRGIQSQTSRDINALSQISPPDAGATRQKPTGNN